MSIRTVVHCAPGLVFAVLLAAASSPASADDQTAILPVATELPAHPIVFRVSDVALNSLLNDETFDRQTDVRDVILGTSIRGKARIIGKPGVQLAESPEQATFYITFTGTVNSRTTGYNGPAIIYSRSVTKFMATKRVVFEPGRGFYGLPSKVTAQTETFVEGIGSTRGGFIGRIVRRRAAKIEAERHAEATEIARQKIQRRIATAFERHSEERLARLTWVTRLRYLAATTLRAGGSTEPQYTFSTTRNYLQLAPSRAAGSSVIDLPLTTDPLAGKAPMELWIHESLGGERLAAALGFLDTPDSTGTVLKTVVSAARLLAGGAEPNDPLQSLIDGNHVQLHKTGSWRVIAMQPQSTSPRLIADLKHTAIAEKIDIATPNSQENLLLSHRTWTSGKYHAEAAFLALEGDLVRLRRVNGVRTSIPLAKLSPIDQAWIATHLASR